MLKRYDVVAMPYGAYMKLCECGQYVRYEDAAALELRIRELEQQLMTEAEKRAAFELDCEREP